MDGVHVASVCWYAAVPCGHMWEETDEVFATWKAGYHVGELNREFSRLVGRLKKVCPNPGCQREVRQLYISQDAPEILRYAAHQHGPSQWEQEYVVPGCCGQLMTEAVLWTLVPDEYRLRDRAAKVDVAALNHAMARSIGRVSVACPTCHQPAQSIGRATTFSAKVRALLPQQVFAEAYQISAMLGPQPSAPPLPYNPEYYGPL